MKTVVFRFTFFIATCLILASVAGNLPLWALSDPSEAAVEYIFETIEVPGAVITYADDMNAAGTLVGSYVDADGVYHGYIRHADGSFTTFDFPGMLSNLEYLFVNAINDAGVIVFRAKEFDSSERTYIRLPNGELKELKFPGSVTTVARDIDRVGQVVGYYDALDGRRYGFIAKPLTSEIVKDFSNVYVVSPPKGLNMLSVPLKPETPMTARSLAGLMLVPMA